MEAGSVTLQAVGARELTVTRRLILEVDESVGAGYIQLSPGARSSVAKSVSTDDPDSFSELRGDIVLDLDENGYVVGIEIPSVAQVLPPELLD
ncbi:MAG: DUF2283 domain-containing protein [Solirubrobacteraceae bacterium MAG38_C4-C5]|nr:DUF2283 domain-containing protein [Candidatus Siliceabacter maunaloa]